MRHLKHRFQLGRKKEHRVALMSNLGAALLRHGRIQTTLPKAKALRPFVEKVITLAKKAEGAPPEKALHYRRLALSRIRDKEAVSILFNERAETFKNRAGGYTRIYKLGTRIGDGAEMAVIQIIPEGDEGYPRKTRKSRPAKAGKPEVEETPAAAETIEAPTTETSGQTDPADEEPEAVTGDPSEDEKKE